MGKDSGLRMQDAIPVLMMLRTLGVNASVLKELGNQVAPGRTLDEAITRTLDEIMDLISAGRMPPMRTFRQQQRSGRYATTSELSYRSTFV